MPVNDWEDSWYDDPSPAPNQRGRGGVVAVAVVTFIMCGFNALSASCLFFCGVMWAAIENGPLGAGQGNVLSPAVVMVTFAIGGAISFVTQIVAGVGLVNGRQWSRILSLCLAGYSTLTAGLIVFYVFNEFNFDNMTPDQSTQLVVMGFGFVFHLGYAATTFFVLLNANVARSFR